MNLCFSSGYSRPFVAFCLLTWATACNQPDAQAKLEANAEPAGQRQAAAASDPQKQAVAVVPTAASSSYDEEAFTLTFTGPAQAKVGEEVTFAVTLSAKNGYKVNDEYPVKFRFAVDAAVSPKKETLSKEDAQVEKTKVQFQAPVVIKQAGSHSIGGKLSFSVCTEERCLIEKRDLAQTITAS